LSLTEVRRMVTENSISDSRPDTGSGVPALRIRSGGESGHAANRSRVLIGCGESSRLHTPFRVAHRTPNEAVARRGGRPYRFLGCAP
jgi:hypothetical protein